MEVEFDVKITPAVLYDYLLYHTYSSASGLIGSLAGALMVVAFFMDSGWLCLPAGVIILAYLPWTLFIKSKRQYLANPSFREPLHYRMTEEGIEVSQGDSLESQTWENMVKAVSTSRSIIVYTSRVNASIFPRKDLGDQGQAVIQMIAAHMPPKKVKIRL